MSAALREARTFAWAVLRLPQRLTRIIANPIRRPSSRRLRGRSTLRAREALIDLGTGPGVLARGFAPYVGRIVGVDPEPAMVAEARRSAEDAEIAFPVIEGRVEDLAADPGPFDLITVGRALHWMDRLATLAAFDRLLTAAGRVLICGSSTVSGRANPWRAAFDATMRSWGDGREGKHQRLYEHWFDGSRFAQVAEIKIAYAQAITPDDLVERALTRSTSSRAVLGTRVDAFRGRSSQRWRRSLPIQGARRSSRPRSWFSRRPDAADGTPGRVGES